jgi:hypothetical protein
MPEMTAGSEPVAGKGSYAPNDVAVAILTVDRDPQYVFQTLASMFLAEPALHVMDPIWILVGSDDASHLSCLLHHDRIRVIALSRPEAQRIKLWRIHRKFKHNYHRCLRVPLDGKRGIIVAEDDVVFRDHFVSRCLQAVQEIESDDLRDYALALFSAYDFHRDPSFYRGQYYCSYGWSYYGTPCMYYPRKTAEFLAVEFERFLGDDNYDYESDPQVLPGDLLIGRHYGTRMYASCHALAQHVGATSTGLGGGGGTVMFDREYAPVPREAWGRSPLVSFPPHVGHDASSGFLQKPPNS